MHQRLPVLYRLGKHMVLSSTSCKFCQQHTETQDHLFFECPFATELWHLFCTEWNLNLNMDGMEAFIISLRNLTMPRRLRSLIQAMTNAVIYHI